MSDRLSDYYKVPGRGVYCTTFYKWVKETLRCHVWLRFIHSRLPTLPVATYGLAE